MKLSRRGLLGILCVLPFVGKKKAAEPEARVSVPRPKTDSTWSQLNGVASFPESTWQRLKNITPGTLEKGDVAQISLRGDAAVRPTYYSKSRHVVSLDRVEPGQYGRFATRGLTYVKTYTTQQANFTIHSSKPFGPYRSLS